MTVHLTSDELLAAAENTLDAGRREHVDACEACRLELQALKAVESQLRAVEVPEPSPLFWEHFSARVHRATLETQPSSSGWFGRRWLVSAACAASVLVLMFSLREMDHQTPATTVGTDALAIAPADEDRWDDVLQMAAQLPADDLGTLAVTGETPALVDDLSAAERVAFVHLLAAEMQRSQ
ncbi:MAG: hypothetical protein ABI051_05695 [Vicinamibacterales bacterium]